jgi:hypothetical protein
MKILQAVPIIILLWSGIALAASFVDNGNGTISDQASGLTWKKCSEGQSWDPENDFCSGTITTFTWQEALQRAEAVNKGTEGESLGQVGWRLPNIKELASVVDLKICDPAIDGDYFPETDSSGYWSSTASASSVNDAWGVGFFDGYDFCGDIDYSYRVRLVRAGP